MKPNPDIALIYHYDLARALAGEIVDWQAIPVNVQAGRAGGDLCRAAADFAKRRDLFAMPAPTQRCVCGEPETEGVAHRYDAPCYVLEEHTIAAPVPPVAVEQPVADPEPKLLSPVPVSAANVDLAAMVPAWGRDRLRNRIAELVRCGQEDRMRARWPEGVPTLKHPGHTDEQLQQILAAVRRVETEIGAGWHPDDAEPARSRQAIERALRAWGDDVNGCWFAASLIATFEQCRNPDATLDGLVGQFTIEQCERLWEAAPK